LCSDPLLKDDEESSGHVDNNLLILLKKSPDSVDRTSVEVPVRLHDLWAIALHKLCSKDLIQVQRNLKLEALLLP
jgi:hypothetical protein